jgi:protein SCO1/2
MRLRSGLALLTALLALLVSACGGSSAPAAARSDTIAGLQQRPLRALGDLTLPDASRDGAEFPIKAAPNGLLLMYFGYTNCPDVCPGTLAGLRLAIRKLDAAQAARVQVAMATVDPTRDTGPVLTSYLKHFFRDAHALRTEDPGLLRTVAEAFGVRYEVSTNAQGEEDVGHSALSFAVDDQGRLVDTWPYGFSENKIANDMRILLRASARPPE